MQNQALSCSIDLHPRAQSAACALGRIVYAGSTLAIAHDGENRVFALRTSEGDVVAKRVARNAAPITVQTFETGYLGHLIVLDLYIICKTTRSHQNPRIHADGQAENLGDQR